MGDRLGIHGAVDILFQSSVKQWNRSTYFLIKNSFSIPPAPSHTVGLVLIIIVLEVSGLSLVLKKEYRLKDLSSDTHLL